MSRRLWTLALLSLAVARGGAVELAIIPPVGDEAVATALRAAFSEVGITVTVLDPAQLVDRARFVPSVYRLAILVGGERYPDSVVDDGDVSAAITAYVAAGGALLVAADGPALARPQRWSGADGWQSVQEPLRRVQLQTQLGLLDAGVALEATLPDGCELVTGPGSALADQLPERIALPAARPYRPIPSNQDPAVSFLPIATLVDAQGGTYGAAAAELRREGAGAVYYCWAPLLTSEVGGKLLYGILSRHSAQAIGETGRARQTELMLQLNDLQALQQQAVGYVPEGLESDRLTALREELRRQGESIADLREATRLGNLEFVALKLAPLRDELAVMPAEIGVAIDEAVLRAVIDVEARPIPLEEPRSGTGQPQPAADAVAQSPAIGELPAPAGAELHAALPPMDLRSVAPPIPDPVVAPGGGSTAAPQPTAAGGVLPDVGNPSGPADLEPPPITPRSPGGETPTTPGGETPTTPGGETPTTPGGETPTTPGGETPTTPGGETPTTPGGETPTTPGGETPTTPGGEFETANPVIFIDIENRGRLAIELYPDVAPKTCSSILYLMRSGFYHGIYFHKVYPDFVVQVGCPFAKPDSPDEARIGTGGPDWFVPGEFTLATHHERGTCSLARLKDDPDSGGSQFFICLRPQPQLDGQWAVFGKVIGGLELLDQLQIGDVITATGVVQGAEAANPPGVGPLDLFN